MLEKVYLIGEHHLDLLSKQRYSHAFTRFQPDNISLEQISPAAQDLERAGNFLAGFKQPEAMLNCLGLGIYSAAQEYAASNSQVGIHFIEEISGVREELINAGITLSKENLSKLNLVKLIYQQAVIKPIWPDFASNILDWSIIYTSLVEYISTGQDILQANSQLDALYPLLDTFDLDNKAVVYEQFDEVVLTKILSLDGTVVHGGGLNHIFGQYNNLYEKIKAKGIEVERYKLISFNNDH